MNVQGSPAWAIGFLVAGVVAGSGLVLASEPEFLAEEAAGIYPLDGERALRVEGFSGSVNVRAGKDGELRFRATLLDDPRAEIPVELWRDGRALLLVPTQKHTGESVRLEAAVDRSVDVAAHGSGLELVVSRIEGDVTAEGDDLELLVSSIGGSVVLDLNGGTARVQEVGGDMSVDSRDVDVQLGPVSGMLEANLVGGSLLGRSVGGNLELDAEGADVEIDGVAGPVRAEAADGRIKLMNIAAGGRFDLTDAPLELEAVAGDVHVQSDAEISFRDCKADLHFNNFGAGVRGVGNEGLIEVKTESAAVTLEDIAGPVRIEGNSLQVQLTKIGGELWVLGTSSDIGIDGASELVRVENEYGDVRIRNGAKTVQVTSRNGNVDLQSQNGPVRITADGERVSVGWVSLNWESDSVIENESGDVDLWIPNQGGCYVDVSSKYGPIENEIETLEVSGDGNRVSGTINRTARPRLEVRTAGAVRIRAGTGQTADPDE